MNSEIQLFKTSVTVENSSITVDGATWQSTAARCCLSPFRRHPQAASVVHKPTTADSQVIHGRKSLRICLQLAAEAKVTHQFARSIDSVAARFSTTAKYLKL
jgi:hypothetical protein